MTKQYTVRSVSEAIDRAVRHRAMREAKTINSVLVEALARGLEVEPVEYRDLDPRIGTWQEDPAFDNAVADFERINDAAGR